MSDQTGNTSPAKVMDDPKHHLHHWRKEFAHIFTVDELRKLVSTPDLLSALELVYDIDVSRPVGSPSRLTPGLHKILEQVGAAPRMFNGEPELLREVRHLAKHLDDKSFKSIKKRMVEYYPRRMKDILLALHAWNEEVRNGHPGTTTQIDITTK